jgi:hypothetical protein
MATKNPSPKNDLRRGGAKPGQRRGQGGDPIGQERDQGKIQKK